MWLPFAAVADYNTSEKRRIEKMNAKVTELHELICSMYQPIPLNKNVILTKTLEMTQQLQDEVAGLRDKSAKARERMNRRLHSVQESVGAGYINYHDAYVQNPVPQAVIGTDGLFVDANKQWMLMTGQKIEQIRQTSLFGFTNKEDLPCALGCDLLGWRGGGGGNDGGGDSR